MPGAGGPGVDRSVVESRAPNGSTVLEAVLRRCGEQPELPALEDATQALSYAELAQSLNEVTEGLHQLGIGAGDRVALAIPNSVDFLVVALAVNCVGGVFVPLPPTDPPARLQALLEDCRPRLVVLPSGGGARRRCAGRGGAGRGGAGRGGAGRGGGTRGWTRNDAGRRAS